MSLNGSAATGVQKLEAHRRCSRCQLIGRDPTADLQWRPGQSQLSASPLQELKDLAQQYGSTLFMALLAVFDILMARWTGQDDVVVGTPIAGRQRRELEELVGFFRQHPGAQG